MQPWYSLLTCRLLGFIGNGAGLFDLEQAEERIQHGIARPVLSSHRLSQERRSSSLSMASVRCARTPVVPPARIQGVEL